MHKHLPPVLVHVVFHPESASARKLAWDIHQALNADPNLPGLRIPTVFCAENIGVPPADQGLERAQRSLVVPLADVDLIDADDWCRFVADLWESCQGNVHRCVPVQLTEYNWPSDSRLNDINFVRAFNLPEEERNAFVIRRLIIELCRFLNGDPLQTDSPEAPVKVFISHTKLDLQQEPRVVEAIKSYLSQDQPIKTWFDSGDIPGGSVFAREIEKGIEDACLLCVRTDHYAGREWCRKEVLLAKEKARPMVVINALTSQEVRSFPYLGNLPEIRWNGRSETAIDLLLKEALRHLHSRLILKPREKEGDVVFIHPPEHLTTATLPPGTTILYPDPPLGKEEVESLSKRGLDAKTPLERMAVEKSLKGKPIAISVSECPDIRRNGLDGLHYQDAVQDLSRYLLIKGATLVYGGHLGSEGFTEILKNLVAAHNRLKGVDPIERIENYVGWPLPYDKELKVKFKEGAVLKRVPRPDDIDETLAPELKADPELFSADISPLHRYAWARGMTAMREEQTASCKARIIMGGSTGPTIKRLPDGREGKSWYAGRIPGTLEELLLSLRDPQPVFVIGAFGGVAGMVADLLEGRERIEMTWEFQRNAPHAPEMRALYEKRGDIWWDYTEMRDFLMEKGVAGLNPGLTEEEHRELFHTTDITQMLELVIRGLDRLEA